MVPITALWLPILLSAVFVFIIGFVMHMVFTYHQSDYAKLPNEDEVRDALRPFNIPPGDYVVPHASDNKERGSEDFAKKLTDGPSAFITILENKMPSMTGKLVQWFVFCLVVGVFAAYIAGRALGPDAHYLEVFRFTGCTAFIGYSLALVSNSIWYKMKWSTTLKNMFDGLIYALLTAGTFGWLWPG